MSEVLLTSIQTISRVVEIDGFFSPVTLAADGITGGNQIAVQYVPVDRTDGNRVEGTPFALFQKGGALVLTDVNNDITIYGPCVFRLEANLAGATVYMSKGDNP